MDINLPSNIKPGNYRMEVFVGDKKASSGFIVKNTNKSIDKYLVYVLIFIFLLFFLVFYIYNRKLNKLVKHISKVSAEDIVKKK